MTTDITTVIATALDIVVVDIIVADIVVVDIVGVVIIDPRDLFPPGTTSVCLTHCHLSYSAKLSMHQFSYALSRSTSLVPFPFDSLFRVGTQSPLPPLSLVSSTPSSNATTPPPTTLQTYPYTKLRHVTTAIAIAVDAAIDNDVASAVASIIDTAVDIAVDIAVASTIINSVATYISTNIAITVDIPVAAAIVTVITTAVDIVDEIFVSVVDVAIVEPRVQFLPGAPSICISSGTVSPPLCTCSGIRCLTPPP